MINKRIFGSEMPINVQKKLEARQLVAVGDKKPEESITSKYDTESTDKYNELLSSNFDMQGDLSSRTSFARMWTAVSLVNNRDFTVSEGTKTSENAADKKVMSILNKLRYKELYKEIYIVGTHNLNTIDRVYDLNSNSSVQDYTAEDIKIHKAIFPTEHGVDNDNNKFLKPQAGIVSISSDTEGVMGTIKKTTINFVVHNFADYDAIYNKYFMRPGATVFVDFGWDTLIDSDGQSIPLYNPADIIADVGSVGVRNLLYGEADKNGALVDGFVTKCNGDLEVLQGIVTNYNSKILENGSVECSITLTSKNTALLLSAKYHGEDEESAQAKFEFEIDEMIFFEQAFLLEQQSERADALSDKGLLQKTVNKVANSTITSADELEFQRWLDTVKFQSFSSKFFQPSVIAAAAGLFVIGDSSDTEDSYIAWGLLEDKIFNAHFGHGNDTEDINSAIDLQVNIDSSNAFTKYDSGFIEKQDSPNNSPVFLVPGFWDFTYSFNPANEKTKAKPLMGRVEEFKSKPDYGVTSKDVLNEKLDAVKSAVTSLSDEDKRKPFDGETIVTKFDKDQKRIPIREIFIHTQIVKDAFSNKDNNTFKSIVNEILEKINEEAYGLWDWKLVGSDSNLEINDMNYSDTGTGTINERISKFDKIFKFEVMSKNSIVKSYEVSLDMPDGDIGSMYAIQAMTGTPGKMYPVSKVIENQSALQSILNNPKNVSSEYDNLGFRYLPDEGAYNALNIEHGKLTASKKIQYFAKNVNSLVTKKSHSGMFTGVVSLDKPVVETKNTEDSQDSSESSDGGYNTEKMIKLNMEKSNRKNVTVDEYYQYKITGSFLKEKHFKSIPLPMTLTITIYGISSITPGDIFRVDYLPEAYLTAVYFQTMKVSHTVGSDGWYTTLETQFRVSPHRYDDVNIINSTEKNIPDVKDELEKAIIDNQLLDKNNEEDKKILDNVLNNSIVQGQNNNEPPPIGLLPTQLCKNPPDGNEGLLDEDIDDSRAYVWDNKSGGYVGFTTRLDRSNQAKYIQQYHNHYANWFKLKVNMDQAFLGIGNGSGWNFHKPVVDNINIPYESHTIECNGTTYKKVYINRDFSSLLGFMDELDKVADADYDFIKHVFEFTIASDNPVYIAAPMYFWGEDRNRYNGYGEWTNFYYGGKGKDNANNKYGYLGGLFFPGERVSLVINKTHGGKYHWIVLPKVHGQPLSTAPSGISAHPNFGKTVDLKEYDISTHSRHWSDDEWEDEGWESGGMPEKY